MYTFKIIHHIPGRIRIVVPELKKLPFKNLIGIWNGISKTRMPAGIKDVLPNPLSGSIVITYEPREIDIVSFIENVLSNPQILAVVNNGTTQKA